MIRAKSYFDKEKVIKITKDAQIKSFVMSLILSVLMVGISVFNMITAFTGEEIDWFSLVLSVIILVVTFLLIRSTLKSFNTSGKQAVKEMNVEYSPIEIEYVFKEKRIEITTTKDEVVSLKTIMVKNLDQAKVDSKGVALHLNTGSMFYIYNDDFIEGNKQKLIAHLANSGIKVK